MFRKSHLLNKGGSFDPGKQLTKADFPFFPGGALIRVRWSKTIQFREVVQIPLIAGGMETPPTKLLSAVLRNFANGGKLFVLFYTGSKDWHCRDGLFNLGRCFDSNMIN